MNYFIHPITGVSIKAAIIFRIGMWLFVLFSCIFAWEHLVVPLIGCLIIITFVEWFNLYWYKVNYNEADDYEPPASFPIYLPSQGIIELRKDDKVLLKLDLWTFVMTTALENKIAFQQMDIKIFLNGVEQFQPVQIPEGEERI